MQQFMLHREETEGNLATRREAQRGKEENVDGRVGKVSRPLTKSTPSTCSYQYSLNNASSHLTIWNTK